MKINVDTDDYWKKRLVGERGDVAMELLTLYFFHNVFEKPDKTPLIITSIESKLNTESENLKIELIIDVLIPKGEGNDGDTE